MQPTRRVFLAAGLIAPLGARSWDRPPFPEWNDEFIDKILTDSPWARPITLPFRFSSSGTTGHKELAASRFAQIGEPLGLPPGWPSDRSNDRRTPRIDDGPAPPVQTEIYLTTRWSSAEPVRQALALHQYGRGGLASPKAITLLKGDPEVYTVDVAGFPVGMIPQGVRRFEAQLLESVGLTVKGRRPFRATSASVPEHGNHLIATLQFPRFENLTDAEGLIEFSAQAGPMEIRQRFKLRDMNYRGRLEL